LFTALPAGAPGELAPEERLVFFLRDDFEMFNSRFKCTCGARSLAVVLARGAQRRVAVLLGIVESSGELILDTLAQ
jgi:hypothetical protein